MVSPDCECCVISCGWFPIVWISCADVSEHSVCSIFTGRVNEKKCQHITFRCWGSPKRKNTSSYVITNYCKVKPQITLLSTILASLTKYIHVYALTLLSHLLTSGFVFSASGGIILFFLFSSTCSNAMCEMYLDLYFSQWKLKMHALSNEMWYLKNFTVLYTMVYNENKQTKNNTAHVTSRH